MTPADPLPTPTPLPSPSPSGAPAPAPAPAPPSPTRLHLCERLLTDQRAEIARADSKAAVLVAALGMTAGVFSGLLAGRGWTPDALSTAGTLCWWTGVLALTVSLCALLLAVLPRYRTGTWAPGRPLTYFGDIRRAVAGGHLDAALADTQAAPEAGLVAALTDTSLIAWRKHQWIRAGLIAFCAGTLLLPASLLIG